MNVELNIVRANSKVFTAVESNVFELIIYTQLVSNRGCLFGNLRFVEIIIAVGSWTGKTFGRIK